MREKCTGIAAIPAGGAVNASPGSAEPCRGSGGDDMAETMKEIVLARRPEGDPVPEDFRLEEHAIPDCPKGGILVRVLWQSLDPYMRGRMDESKSYAPSVPIGGRMEAGCVAEILESDHAEFRAGEIIEGRFGWGTHAVSDGK